MQYNITMSRELWDDWKNTVPRKYSPLNERIVELLVLDMLFREEFGPGVIEYIDRNEIIDYEMLLKRIEEAPPVAEEDTESNSQENN